MRISEPTTDGDLLYSIDGAVAHVVFNRPKARNALTFEMYARLGDICAGFEGSGPVRALVISGAGGKAFAAGTDISQFRDFKGGADGLAYEQRMAHQLGRIEACKIPVIAAISGACTGGGAAIAACCDIRIASADMKYGFPIARTLGNCLSASNLAKLVSILGEPKVVEMLFTSRLMDATEAKATHLVTEVLATHDAVVARAIGLARELATLAPLTLQTTKALLRRNREAREVVQDEDLVAKVYGSVDFREGLESFLAKRPPHWIGR